MSERVRVRLALYVTITILLSCLSAFAIRERILSTQHRLRADTLSEALAISDESIVIIVVDGSTQRVVEWTAGAAKLFGWTRAEMLGENLDRIVPLESRERHNSAVAAAVHRGQLKDGKVQIVKGYATTRDGRLAVVITVRMRMIDGKAHMIAVVDKGSDVQMLEIPAKEN